MGNLTWLRRFRDLLWLWTMREIRVRYKQSILGVAWAILQPLAMTLILTVVFTRLVRVDTGGIPYPLFAYSALVPWTFFSASLSFGIPSLVSNMNLVTKVHFPRQVLPLASISAALLDFLVAFVILGGMLVFYRSWPGLEALWVIPLLAVEITLIVAVTLIGSAVIVFFRDMRFVLPLLIQLWMYATPIIYPVEAVPQHLHRYYFLNPMASIIDGYRRVLVMGKPPRIDALLLGAVVSAIACGLALLLFKWAEPAFADVI